MREYGRTDCTDGRALPDTEGLEFFSTCPRGFERMLADELSGLGILHVRALRGQVSFHGTLGDAYRTCLWSRLASRVVLVLGRVPAADGDSLYQGLSAIPWEDHVSSSATVAVDAHGTNADLRNTQYIAQRSKDAVVDRVRARTGARPAVDTHHPDVTVSVRVSRERATVGIDLSGSPLFRRGYESVRPGRRPIAALRPDYAAALLAAGGWYRDVRPGRNAPTLACAYCGTGTVLVEAAAQALDRAPGLLRVRWGFERWLGHEGAAWERLMDDARQRAELGSARDVTLLACDTRPDAEASGRQALRAAGMDVPLDFGDATHVASRLRHSHDALLACDLSWVGEDEAALQASGLAGVVRAASGLAGRPGTVATFARDATIDFALGCEPESTTDSLVGRDEASIRTYDAVKIPAKHPTVDVTVPGGRQEQVAVLVGTSDQFARRLAKVWRQRRRWAEREDVSCFRVYDADLPDYAVTIDLFQGSELMPTRHGRGRWLQVYEYAAPRDVDPTLARRRLLDVLAIAPRTIGVAPEDVFVRVRSHGRGGSQYADEARGIARGEGGRVPLPRGAHLVDEGGLTFEVNFGARLDCGLFLDHRETRSLVREMMKRTRGSKRFLNLFAYTGTATCYAADGGARHTTTVDMSRPSLEWARRNMERNGFSNEGGDRPHEYVQADVISWVQGQRHTRNRWDLVFCDVPTFSNSRQMRGSWDVQRDHAELIIGVSRLLTRDGCAIFSCNLRGFRPDVGKLARAGVELEDITDRTIPEDFARNARVHHCYLVRRSVDGVPGD